VAVYEGLEPCAKEHQGHHEEIDQRVRRRISPTVSSASSTRPSERLTSLPAERSKRRDDQQARQDVCSQHPDQEQEVRRERPPRSFANAIVDSGSPMGVSAAPMPMEKHDRITSRTSYFRSRPGGDDLAQQQRAMIAVMTLDRRPSARIIRNANNRGLVTAPAGRSCP